MKMTNRITMALNSLAIGYRGGVNTFVRNFHALSPSTQFFMLPKNSGNGFIDFECAHEFDYKSDIVILSDFHDYPEDHLKYFLENIKSRTQVLAYIHGPDSMKEENEWILDYVNGFLYDRPELMNWFDLQYGTHDSYRHELTLPYCVRRHEFIPESKARIVCSFGRIIPFKGFEKLIEESSKIMAQIIIFGYLGGEHPKSVTKELDRYLKGISREKEDVTYISDIYGLSESEIRGILMASQVFVDNLQYPIDNIYGVQYTALEAMNMKCLPVVSKSIRGEFIRQGFRCATINEEEFQESINYTLDTGYEFKRFAIETNILAMNIKSDIFKEQLREIKEDLL